MKNIIIERLLDQGHITIKIADVIINNKTGKADHITDLRGDSIISNSEALILLRDNEAPSFPFGVPNQPVMPLTYPYNITYCYDKVMFIEWSKLFKLKNTLTTLKHPIKSK